MTKFCVVTGGTKGIGRAILERFARAGFDLATCARHDEDLKELSGTFQSAFQQKVYVSRADLSRRDDAKEFVRFIQELKRPVDVLVNNAGFFSPGTITEEPDGALEALINANLYSGYHVTRGLVQGMKTRSEGHIFNICSIASITAYANGGSYAISKFAQLGFSKVLREELKETGIRVTAVLPGATRTPSWDGVDLPEERFMRPEDVAESVFAAYNLSPRSVVEELVIRPQLGDL